MKTDNQQNHCRTLGRYEIKQPKNRFKELKLKSNLDAIVDIFEIVGSIGAESYASEENKALTISHDYNGKNYQITIRRIKD